MELGMYPIRKQRHNRIERPYRWGVRRQHPKRVLTKDHIYRGRMSYNYRMAHERKYCVEERYRRSIYLAQERRENRKFELKYGGAKRMDACFLMSGGKRMWWDSTYHTRLHRRVPFRGVYN